MGKDSSPEDINRLLPQMSKGQFKAAVGVLLREGAIVADPFELKLIPAELRVVAKPEPYTGKAPQGWRPPEGCTVYVGNLPFEVDEMELARAVETIIGTGFLASVKLSKEFGTGKSRGFGHLEFLEAARAEACIGPLAALAFRGRKARVDAKKRLSERPKPVERREWGDSSSGGLREFRGVVGSASHLSKLWTTVYAGNLPYDLSSDSLKFLIESQLKEVGCIAGVRVAQDIDTGKSRGFAHLDFFDSAHAERAVKQLNGMDLQGRALKLDLEKEKKAGVPEGSPRPRRASRGPPR